MPEAESYKTIAAYVEMAIQTLEEGRPGAALNGLRDLRSILPPPDERHIQHARAAKQ